MIEFGGSSAAAAAAATTPPPQHYSQHHQLQSLQFSHGSVIPHHQNQECLTLSQKMQGDTCFHCHQQGHWARDCLFKTPLKKYQPSTSTSTPNGPDLPLLRCRCELGYCLVRVSHTVLNPGRKFYTCPGVNVRLILLSQFPYFLIWVLLGFQFSFFFFVTFYRIVNVGSLSGVTKSQMVKISSLLCVHVVLESVKGLRSKECQMRVEAAFFAESRG